MRFYIGTFDCVLSTVSWKFMSRSTVRIFEKLGYLIGEHGIYRERPKHNNVNFYFLIQ